MSGLQGKAIVVTRAPHQADALALLFAEREQRLCSIPAWTSRRRTILRHLTRRSERQRWASSTGSR